MYLEANIKVTKMYRKGEMRRKKCKERVRGGGGGGGGGEGAEWDDRDTDSERGRIQKRRKK